eukprot:TRINITY_DN790_c0_g1_i3.p2 TRINITY_DN790_c0_g1~~TRINITY_DN790_c0_g1_i3.p2  ORF type:complete len:213 (+),score=55.71 TRINITY_DN790_c0_g1_i3:592-1230(+)
MPETSIGFFPDVGGTYFLPRLKGNLGLFLALTGARLKGFDNVIAGIATHYVPQSDLPELEAHLTKGGAKKVEEVLSRFHKVPEGHVSEIQTHGEEIARVFGKKRVEEVVAALEAESSEWAAGHLATLKKVSPTSLKVSQQQINVGSSLSLRDALELEAALSDALTDLPDFSEGVRALLVDKDKKPKWQPPTLQEVSDEMIADLFTRKTALPQ